MENKKINVLFASFEATPFIKTGGLGDVAGALPATLNSLGVDVRVIVPKLKTIPDEFKNKMTHITSFYVPLSWRNEFCGIEKLVMGKTIYYFIDNEYYFKRSEIYGSFDDGERMAYYCKAVCESIQYLSKFDNFDCNIIHANDWHASLIPVFLREFYQQIPLYQKIKTLFTIHNIKYQGQMSDAVLSDVLGLGHIKAAREQLYKGKGTINFLQGALYYSDWINTVSPNYASELKNSFYGEGMDGILRQRSDIFSGILNGIDNDYFNPETDKNLPCNYNSTIPSTSSVMVTDVTNNTNNINTLNPPGTIGSENISNISSSAQSVRDLISGKKKCKEELLKEVGLDTNTDIMLVAMVSRLTEQKGMDLVMRMMDELLYHNIRMIILGVGDRNYEVGLKYFDYKHPDKFKYFQKFDEGFSHRIYAGADLFLMPSKFEPCGLGQMIAMRYGTLPLVRETGGLKDSVNPYNQFTGEGNGFSFANFNAHDMLFKFKEAYTLYYDNKPAWKKLMQSAMKTDFAWEKSAKEYIKIYNHLLSY